jgi:quinol monooxygenase YgiN
VTITTPITGSAVDAPSKPFRDSPRVARSVPDNEEEHVIIVGGSFEMDPEQRDAFLAERHERMRTSRSEDGCLEYTFAADPLEPGRVVLFERWESQAALDEHLAVISATMTVTPRSASITLYDVAGERPLR